MVKATDVSLRFRDGVESDAESISALGRQTYSEFFGQVYQKSDLDQYLDRYFSVERVRTDLQNPEIDYRIAYTPSNMVGYAKIGPTSLPQEGPADHSLQLHRLYVRETRRGVGVGGILLSWAIDRAKERGAEKLYLGVWISSENAIKLYQSRGFIAQGEYMIEVGSTSDRELIMSLKLKEKAVA